MSKKEILGIDITDWVERLYEILRNEDVSFDSEEAIIESLIGRYKLTSSQAGEILTAAKHKGLLPESIRWPEPKVSLSCGGGQAMRLMVKADLVPKTLPNGREVMVRKRFGDRQDIEQNEEEFESELSQPIDLLKEDNYQPCVTQNGHVKNNGNGLNGFVTPRSVYVLTQSPEGIESSKYYLRHTVVCHIRQRMSSLAGLSDLRLIAEELKKEIDNIVNEFS